MDNIDLAYIIDDDEIIIHLTESILKKVDFARKTVTFGNGLLAIENLKQALELDLKLPDVILFDLNMPVMDGWEFVSEFIRLKLPKEIPLFVFSSSIDPADQRRAYDYPGYIHGFISKPLTVQKLNKICRLVT